MSKADKLRIKDYLTHIVEAIERINRYIDNMSEEEFDRDEKTQDAVIRNFEVIGEASRNIERYHADFAAGHPEVPWGIAYEMRNILTHGYFTVDIEVVWQTTQDNLPTLAGQIRKLLGCMGEVIDNPSLKTSPFEELPIEVDTHELFDTISHSHLDFVDSPDGWVELMVVGCSDGRYFIENGRKDQSGFNRFEEISQPYVLPYKEPRFFTDEKEAWDRAEEIMKEVYPAYTKEGYR